MILVEFMGVEFLFKKIQHRSFSVLNIPLFIFFFFLSFYISGQENDSLLSNIQKTPLRINVEGDTIRFSVKIEKEGKILEKYQGKAVLLKDFNIKEITAYKLSPKEQSILKMTLDVIKEPFFLLKENKDLWRFDKKYLGSNDWLFEANTNQAKDFLKILVADTYSISPSFDEQGILSKINTKMTSSKYHHHNFDVFYHRVPFGIKMSNIKGLFFDTKTDRKAIIEILFDDL